METKKSKFDGLVVKFNDYLKTGIHDCDLCCLNHSDACDRCPLVDVNCYFVDPSLSPSKLSFKDQAYVNEVIKDLRWLADNLESSLSLGLVFSSTIEMTKASLSLSSLYLSRIQSFDD